MADSLLQKLPDPLHALARVQRTGVWDCGPGPGVVCAWAWLIPSLVPVAGALLAARGKSGASLG